MLMIQNGLYCSQHPHELITYGVTVLFSKLGYLLTMQYLSEMTDEQTLTMYGHPMGLFPSQGSTTVVVTNGMVIPNYSL
jgi:urocanate hydratase